MTDANKSTDHQVTHKVTFSAVGRGKKNWTETLRQFPTEAVLQRLVRKSKALASSDIECAFDEDMEYGVVIVGGFRPVGSFRVQEVSREEA